MSYGNNKIVKNNIIGNFKEWPMVFYNSSSWMMEGLKGVRLVSTGCIKLTLPSQRIGWNW